MQDTPEITTSCFDFPLPLQSNTTSTHSRWTSNCITFLLKRASIRSELSRSSDSFELQMDWIRALDLQNTLYICRPPMPSMISYRGFFGLVLRMDWRLCGSKLKFIKIAFKFLWQRLEVGNLPLGYMKLSLWLETWRRTRLNWIGRTLEAANEVPCMV